MSDRRVYTGTPDIRQGFIVGRLGRDLDHLLPEGDGFLTRCGINTWIDYRREGDERRLCKRCEATLDPPEAV